MTVAWASVFDPLVSWCSSICGRLKDDLTSSRHDGHDVSRECVSVCVCVACVSKIYVARVKRWQPIKSHSMKVQRLSAKGRMSWRHGPSIKHTQCEPVQRPGDNDNMHVIHDKPVLTHSFLALVGAFWIYCSECIQILYKLSFIFIYFIYIAHLKICEYFISIFVSDM